MSLEAQMECRRIEDQQIQEIYAACNPEQRMAIDVLRFRVRAAEMFISKSVKKNEVVAKAITEITRKACDPLPADMKAVDLDHWWREAIRSFLEKIRCET